MPAPFSKGPIDAQQWIAYMDLSGSRNTKKDSHALDRNQLQGSDNTWTAQGSTLSKRPGSISMPGISAGAFGAGPSAGNTGSGVGFIAGVAGRFFDQTTVVWQGSDNFLYAIPMALPGISTGINTYQRIGAISGGKIFAAQLFDPGPSAGLKKNPNGPDGSLFITNGIDTPKIWIGPGNQMYPVPTQMLPLKNDGSGPITPRFVQTWQSNLFYAGDPSDPTMIYIADAFQPEWFASNIINPSQSITQSNYIGMPIGRGDGINGGIVTGMLQLYNQMIIYKESAIYAVTNTGLLGDVIWGASCQSASVGCTSPASIVAYDSFHVFLGIDGVYAYIPGALDITGFTTNTKKLSTNNPDIFDGSTGVACQILDRTSAVACRMGNRYIIFYDGGIDDSGIVAGYPTRGACFDFDKPDADGLPSVTTVSNMTPAALIPLRGAHDSGNIIWADATQDRVGLFSTFQGGIPVTSDFGQPFTVTITGKADFFADEWGPDAAVSIKSVSEVHLLMSFLVVGMNQDYTFNGTLTFDRLTTQPSTGVSGALPTLSEAIVGSAIVGTAVIGVAAGQSVYQDILMNQQEPSQGKIVQVSIQESSIFPWTILGYMLLVNKQHAITQ